MTPTGPSFGPSPTAAPLICPKYTPIGEMRNNKAHSNLLYGFRIHPAYAVSIWRCRRDAATFDIHF